MTPIAILWSKRFLGESWYQLGSLSPSFYPQFLPDCSFWFLESPFFDLNRVSLFSFCVLASHFGFRLFLVGNQGHVTSTWFHGVPTTTTTTTAMSTTTTTTTLGYTIEDINPCRWAQFVTVGGMAGRTRLTARSNRKKKQLKTRSLFFYYPLTLFIISFYLLFYPPQ